MFAYCCLHIHSPGPLCRTITAATYTLLRPARSARNSIERIYEKVECNCLVEGSYCTGCVMCNNFVIVVTKTQSEPGLLVQTYCYHRLFVLSTRIPSHKVYKSFVIWHNFLFATLDASWNFYLTLQKFYNFIIYNLTNFIIS